MEAASDYAKPRPRLTRARRERESPWRPCRPHVRARAACGNAGARARCAVVKHTRARPPCVPSHDDEPNASALPCVSTYTALSRDGHVTRRSAVFASPAVQPPSSVKMHFFLCRCVVASCLCRGGRGRAGAEAVLKAPGQRLLVAHAARALGAAALRLRRPVKPAHLRRVAVPARRAHLLLDVIGHAPASPAHGVGLAMPLAEGA